MPVTKRARSNKWIATFEVRGRQIRRTTPFLALSEYRVAAQAWEDDLRERIEKEFFREEIKAPIDVEYPVTIAEARDLYLKNRNFSFNSAKRVDSEWQLLIDSGLSPNTLIRELTLAQIADCVGWLEKAHVDDTGKVYGPWAAVSINNCITHLKALLNYTKELHPDAGVPELNWKFVKRSEPPGRTRWLTYEEYASLYKALPGYIRPVVQFAVLTGLRRKNITELRWDEVDFPREDLNVIVKGKPPRLVRLPMSKGAVQMLRGIKAGRKEVKGRDRVFVYPGPSELPVNKKWMAGGPIKDFRKTWEKACEECAIYDFRFHDLRHTFAVWWLKEGGSIVALQRMLAHRDITTTMIYADVMDEDLRLSADKLGQRVLGVGL